MTTVVARSDDRGSLLQAQSIAPRITRLDRVFVIVSSFSRQASFREPIADPSPLSLKRVDASVRWDTHPRLPYLRARRQMNPRRAQPIADGPDGHCRPASVLTRRDVSPSDPVADSRE